MNSQNVERTKKIVIPTFLTLGGMWYIKLLIRLSYIAFISFKVYNGSLKVRNFKPTNQMLEKAWEGFEYDPQIVNLQQVHQVFKRAGKLSREVLFEFTKLTKSLRQTNYNLNDFILFVAQEIELKIRLQRQSIKYFLQYKNHSFEQFDQSYYQVQNEEIKLIIARFTFVQFMQYLDKIRCHDPYEQKLPTINECIDNLKILNHLMIEKKPEFDRLRHIIVQNRFDSYRSYFINTYLSDQFQFVANNQFETFKYANKLINFDKIQPSKKAEALKLKEENQLLMDGVLR
ncbi:hypothetical protein pb186bvf_003936 [Paramecium bursaria]